MEQINQSISMFITDKLPIYVFEVPDSIVPIYEVWIGYAYLGTATSYNQTASTSLLQTGKPVDIYVDLQFEWGLISVNSKYLRRLKTLGKFRQEHKKEAPVFTLVQLARKGYLMVGQHLLYSYDDKTQLHKGFRRIDVLPQYLKIVGQVEI